MTPVSEFSKILGMRTIRDGYRKNDKKDDYYGLTFHYPMVSLDTNANDLQQGG